MHPDLPDLVRAMPDPVAAKRMAAAGSPDYYFQVTNSAYLQKDLGLSSFHVNSLAHPERFEHAAKNYIRSLQQTGHRCH